MGEVIKRWMYPYEKGIEVEQNQSPILLELGHLDDQKTQYRQLGAAGQSECWSEGGPNV